MLNIEKYGALIRAAESRFARLFAAYCSMHGDLLVDYNRHLENSVPLPADEKSVSMNPELFEQALAVAHRIFVERHPEFPAIEAEGWDIHAQRGDELERIKEAFMNEGGDEVSFRILHESVLEKKDISSHGPKPPSL